MNLIYPLLAALWYTNPLGAFFESVPNKLNQMQNSTYLSVEEVLYPDHPDVAGDHSIDIPEVKGHQLDSTSMLFCELCTGVATDVFTIRRLNATRLNYSCECPYEMKRQGSDWKGPSYYTGVVVNYIGCRKPIPEGLYLVRGEATEELIGKYGHPLSFWDFIADHAWPTS